MNDYRHSHAFAGDSRGVERRVRWVMFLTLATMVAEIVSGWMFGSLALLADGWHMASHSVAMVITLFAFAFARRHRADPKFTFGTGKVDALGGFASAILLGMIAVSVAWDAIDRLANPISIAYGEAITVAAVGFLVNLGSVLILEPPGHHDEHHEHDHHGHGHDHDHAHHQHKGHSVRAAYVHVLADMLTSVGAILALAAGMFFAWEWLDPLVGLASAVIIAVWAWGLVKSTGSVLLDEIADPELVQAIRSKIEGDADNRIADLHIWSLEPGQMAAIVSVVTHYPRAPSHYKNLLADLDELTHVTIEVLPHEGKPCLDVPGLEVKQT